MAEQEPLQIEIEGTPNPNSAKFVMNRTVVDETRSYFNVGMVNEGDKVADVAKQLFAIPGVRTLMFLNDFVTVSKEGERGLEHDRREDAGNPRSGVSVDREQQQKQAAAHAARIIPGGVCVRGNLFRSLRVSNL